MARDNGAKVKCLHDQAFPRASEITVTFEGLLKILASIMQ